MSFMNELKNTLDNEYNVSITENGAVGYKTTSHKLLDMNFAVASYRSKNEREIIDDFIEAYNENPKYAIKWLFYARDVRGGLGERRLFRVIFRYLANNKPEIAKKLLGLIAEYGRWDDLIELYNCSAVVIKKEVLNILYQTLAEDMSKYAEKKPISLLAKWMPSINTSNKDKVNLAKKLASEMKLSPRDYRKMLSTLRNYLNVVECDMSNNNWDAIEYRNVPSKANLNYNNAFLRHDEERRRAFLEKVAKGEEKVNADVLYPHEIVHKYVEKQGAYHWGLGYPNQIDINLESVWKALPSLFTESTITVADGSGSMTCNIGNSNVRAIEVANALAIYTAEHNKGEFYNKYITFSSRPQLVNLGNKDTTLFEKIRIANKYTECSNTDIEKVFNLILTTAINAKMSQDELPKNVLIISDMEFDSATRFYGKQSLNSRLFAVIKKKFEDAGYKLPRLIFWNVNSRTGTIPVKENDMGVALVSGFSINILKMVMGNSLDPYKLLLEILDDKRYDPVQKVLDN